MQNAVLAALGVNSKQLVTFFLNQSAQADFQFPRYIYNPDGNPKETKLPSPHYLAMKTGDDELFGLLVEKGAWICTTDCPLVQAVDDHQFHMIKVLVEQGRCVHCWVLLEGILQAWLRVVRLPTWYWVSSQPFCWWSVIPCHRTRWWIDGAFPHLEGSRSSSCRECIWWRKWGFLLWLLFTVIQVYIALVIRHSRWSYWNL